MFFWKRKKKEQDEVVSEADVPAIESDAADAAESGVADEQVVEPASVDAAVDAEPENELTAEPSSKAEPEPEPEPTPVPELAKSKGLFARMRDGLSRTSDKLTSGMADLLLGKKEIDDDLIEDLEDQLLSADVGVEATSEIIESLTQRVARLQLADGEALYKAMQETLKDQLKPVTQPLVIDKSASPYVILVVGVNGVGKTTTIGKMAKRFQNQGHSVMLAAGDTFRAAAVEQLQVWGERNNVPVVAQATGADSASVIFDALQSAKSRNIDVVIADTAGRLQNKSNLMEELSKVRRVMAKLDAAAPHEVLLVLDAGTGQNALSQAEAFGEAANVTGLALTKLDGTAKGGVIFSLTQKFGLPVRYIGVGEQVDDLQEFDGDQFVDAIFRQS